jgi:hypothetical protein
MAKQGLWAKSINVPEENVSAVSSGKIVQERKKKMGGGN